jgi:hypothetical protein
MTAAVIPAFDLVGQCRCARQRKSIEESANFLRNGWVSGEALVGNRTD